MRLKPAQPGQRRRRGRAASSATALAAIALFTGAVAVLLAVDHRAVGQTTGQENAAPANSPEPAETASPDAPAETPPAKAEPVKPSVELGPELTPYSVLVRVNVPIDAEVDVMFRDRIVERVATDIRSAMGQMWTATVELSDDPRMASAGGLDKTSAEELTDEFADSTHDKVFLAGARHSGSCWSIAVREWDAASRTAGPVEQESTCDARLVAPFTSDLVMRAFRPVARIESVDGGLVVTNIRAGEFPPADAAYAPFAEGNLLTPFVRYYDRDHNLQQIRPLPYTYLRVSSVTRARMECATVSAYRTPLSGSRRRMELLAIAARPAFQSTRLIVAPHGNRADPLPGCRVEVFNRVPTADDPVDDRLELLTDRRGSIVLSADPEHPLQHVLVHSGKALLARIPLIPGLEETVTLAIPDDAPRLAVEGSLSVLEGELIDAVARRSMLMARARRSSKARNWDEVTRFLEGLQQVPDYEEFRQRVASVQLPAVQSARELGDKVAEARIKKMCADLQQSASSHLDAEKIRQFRIEMDELRRATQ